MLLHFLLDEYFNSNKCHCLSHEATHYMNFTSIPWQLLSRSETHTRCTQMYSKCKHSEHKLCISLKVLLLKLLSLQISSACCYTAYLLRVRLSTGDVCIIYTVWERPSHIRLDAFEGQRIAACTKGQPCPRNRVFTDTHISINPFISISQSQKRPQGNQSIEISFI